MNENNELGAGPLANEETKGLPVVMWAAFDADGDFADITESIGISHGWARAKGFEIRPLVYQGDALIAIAQRDAELAELRASIPQWACRDCGATGNGFITVTDHEGDCDVQCPECSSVCTDEPAYALRTVVDERNDLLAERDALQAELAAMRASLERVLGHSELMGRHAEYVNLAIGDYAEQLPAGFKKRISSYAAPVSAPSQVAVCPYCKGDSAKPGHYPHPASSDCPNSPRAPRQVAAEVVQAWIPTRERMPEVGDLCLIKIPVGTRSFEVEGAKYIGDGKFHGAWCSTRGGNSCYHVTHWLPASALLATSQEKA